MFATKTKMCPTDEDAYFAGPELFTPYYHEAHISASFTWARERAFELAQAWKNNADKVIIGGPAFGDPGNEFILGMYLRKGVIITSRGCPNKCPWCFVPKRSGKLRTLPIIPGRILQDDNLLACPQEHIKKVFAMLKTQKQIEFAGGLEPERLRAWHVETLRGLKTRHIWLSYDYDTSDVYLKNAVDLLARYFRRDQIRCYVLIGFDGDTIQKAEARLVRTWELGTLPFAMLYRDERGSMPSPAWRKFQRQWTRPAIIKAIMGNYGKQL